MSQRYWVIEEENGVELVYCLDDGEKIFKGPFSRKNMERILDSLEEEIEDLGYQLKEEY